MFLSLIKLNKDSNVLEASHIFFQYYFSLLYIYVKRKHAQIQTYWDIKFVFLTNVIFAKINKLQIYSQFVNYAIVSRSQCRLLAHTCTLFSRYFVCFFFPFFFLLFFSCCLCWCDFFINTGMCVFLCN